MSQTNTSILYVGIDVAKATLEMSLRGVSYALSNDAKGHARVLRLLAKAQSQQPAESIHVVIEATGGYESALRQALHREGRPLSLIQPGRVRHFAQAMGQLAKTDKLDASVLVEFGRAVQPPPTMAPSPAQLHLQALVTRRAQLVETQTAERNRAAHYEESWLCRQSGQLLKLLEKQIAACEKQIAAALAADAEFQKRATRVQEVPGIGPTIAGVLQAQLPELGSLSDGQIAALVGLAPYNCDSGPQKGQRHIRGGRKSVRNALYLGAMNAVRFDPILRTFYQRLIAAGKLPMVALTAAMRKLLVLLNRLLKNPDFQLQNSAA